MNDRDIERFEAQSLYTVFHSAVHELASQHYTAEQINAWAPQRIDQERWIKRMQGIRPFVVEHAGDIVAYADINQPGTSITKLPTCGG